MSVIVDPRGGRPYHPSAKDAHAGEFGALAVFLAGPRAPADMDALLSALRVASDGDRIRDAFARRFARQKVSGDVKGAAATKSALQLVDEVLRRPGA